MILERVEKEGLVEAIYESSNIIASSYDKVKQDLNITFIEECQLRNMKL